MSRATSIQNKLEAKVFQGLGSDGTISVLASSTIDKWGDKTKTYGSPTDVKIVPYNVIDERQSFEPFGDLNEDEMDMVIPHTAIANVNDKVIITYSGLPYIIRMKGSYPLLNENLAWVIRLSTDL